MPTKILIATDSREYAARLGEELKRYGSAASLEAVSGPDGLRAASGGASPSLVLLDCGPAGGRDAAAALKAASETFPGVPCLALVEGGAGKELGSLLSGGGCGLLPKGEPGEAARILAAASGALPPGTPAVIYTAAEGGTGWLTAEGDIPGLTGYSREDLFRDPGLWERRADAGDLAEAGPGYGAGREYRWRRADGTLRVFLEKRRLLKGPDGGKGTVLGVVVDVTENRLAAGRAASERKMEAVGRLAGGLAHDFHNLLSSVLGYATLLLGNMTAGDPLRDDVAEIQKAAERAVVLTRKLLVFGGKQAYQPQDLDLNSVFAGLQGMLRQLMRDDIRGISDLEEGAALVRGDLMQLEQVVTGLAMHVCDLIPPGGTLTVSTRGVDVGEEYCRGVPGSRPGRFVRLTVAGTGQAPSGLENIFEPYASGAPEPKAAGLSLPAVYGIVRRHGGWLTASGAEGAGTVFEVYLPGPGEAPAPAAAAAPAREQAPAGAPAVRRIGGNGERVLLVEDEEALRKFVARVLGENGYNVFAAGSVKETLEIFRREKGNFHLVFTDVSLPDGTGVQLAEELLGIKPALKIIFNSGYVNEKSQWPDIQRKGLKFLQKPYTIHNMLAAIKEVIKRPEA